MCCGITGRQKTPIVKPSGHKKRGCKNCGTENEYNVGTCDCCRLVDGDTRQKQVRWCTFCQAFICAECEKNYTKRAKAFFKSLT